MVRFLAVVAFAAFLGYAAICYAEEVQVLANVGDSIVLIPVQEPTLAECKEEWTSLLRGDEEEEFAYPTPASVGEIQEKFEQFLVPQSIPEGLELSESRTGGQGSYTRFEEARDPGRRQSTRALSIEQGPIDGVWRLEAKEGYYEEVTVRGVPAAVVRGGFQVDGRSADGAMQVASCGWDAGLENSLAFVADRYAYRLAGAPAEEFPPDELMAIAESLVEPSESSVIEE